MKKFISLLLCVIFMFSFVTIGVAEILPQLKITVSKQWTDLPTDNAGLFTCFELSLRNCPNFDSCQLIITYNPEVLQFVKGYPFLLDDELRKQTICTVLAPGTLQVMGNHNDCGNHEFDPFCFKVVGEGDTDISVDLVSFRTTDGEVENVAFDADIQNFDTSDYFVRYDLDGDRKLTSADARLALRISVGLLTATDEQCRAVGVVDTNGFTAETARFILRTAIGLEGNAAKTVVQMEWATDEETGYIIYHYSDGTYDTVGPLDAWTDRPDWV